MTKSIHPTPTPSQQPRIRQATAQDADELARLRWDFSPDEVQRSGQPFADFASQFGEFVQRAQASGAWAIWVAEVDERLVANIYVQMIAKVPRPGRFHARYGYVTNVYADPAARGQGIGTALLQAVIGWAREQRLEFLIVWPAEESIRFYERCGFALSREALELDVTRSNTTL
jgi:GNAT superfamily N-acetyltransferase